MGTPAEKLTYLNETKSKIKDNINLTGAGLTNQTPFRQYATDLKTALLNILNNGIDSLYNNFPKTTGTGTNITLNNTLQAPIRSVINGDTEQDGEPTPDNPQEIKSVTGLQKVSVEGKNIWDEQWENGYYNRTTGVKGSGSNYIRCADYIPVQPNTSIYFNKPSDFVNYAILFYDSSFTKIGDPAATNTTSMAFTVPSNASYFTFYGDTGVSGTTYQNNIMITKGTTPSEYEPYQSQEYEINLGKNLFDKDNVNILNANLNNNMINSANAERTVWFKCEPNTTYTFTKLLNSPYTRNAIAETTDIPTINMSIQNFENYVNSPTFTYTTSENAKYLVWWFYNTSSTNYTLQEILDSIQIEEGTEATSYSPYFTPIKLNKTGNYQDYITGTPNNWSIKRQIGSITLNGQETYSTNSSWNYTNTTGFIYNLNNTNSNILSNRFTYSANAYVSDTNGIMGIVWSNQLLFRVSNTIASSVADFKTWLSNNNVEISYPLATETTEPITNTELISQLNDFYNAKSYNGQTNIFVEGDLPMILDVSAIKGE